MLGDSGVANLEWRTISSKTYRPRKSSRLDWLPIGLSKSKAINLELILFNWKNRIYIFQLHRNLLHKVIILPVVRYRKPILGRTDMRWKEYLCPKLCSGIFDPLRTMKIFAFTKSTFFTRLRAVSCFSLQSSCTRNLSTRAAKSGTARNEGVSLCNNKVLVWNRAGWDKNWARALVACVENARNIHTHDTLREVVYAASAWSEQPWILSTVEPRKYWAALSSKRALNHDQSHHCRRLRFCSDADDYSKRSHDVLASMGDSFWGS